MYNYHAPGDGIAHKLDRQHLHLLAIRKLIHDRRTCTCRCDEAIDARCRHCIACDREMQSHLAALRALVGDTQRYHNGPVSTELLAISEEVMEQQASVMAVQRDLAKRRVLEGNCDDAVELRVQRCLRHGDGVRMHLAGLFGHQKETASGTTPDAA